MIFTVSANVVAGSGSGTLVNQATLTAPAGVTDAVAGNNVAVDSDAIGTLFGLTVQKAGTGTGTVLSSPAAIACGTGCASQTASYVSGTAWCSPPPPRSARSSSAGAAAAPGTATTCTATVAAATTVTATFDATTWTVGTSTSTGGSVTCASPVPYGSPSTCTLTALPGYQLTGLTDNGVSVLAAVSGGSYTIPSVTAAHAVAATFTLIPARSPPAPARPRPWRPARRWRSIPASP